MALTLQVRGKCKLQCHPQQLVLRHMGPVNLVLTPAIHTKTLASFHPGPYSLHLGLMTYGPSAAVDAETCLLWMLVQKMSVPSPKV